MTEVRKALTLLDFTEAEQRTVVKTLCAILHLGQMGFKDSDSSDPEAGASVGTKDILEKGPQAGPTCLVMQYVTACFYVRHL